jgi:hypothetical protein
VLALLGFKCTLAFAWNLCPHRMHLLLEMAFHCWKERKPCQPRILPLVRRTFNTEGKADSSKKLMAFVMIRFMLREVLKTTFQVKEK